MTSPEAVGVDVGGTKATAVRIGTDAAVRARSSVETPADDVAGVLEAMRGVAAAVMDPAVVAAGIGAAGLVETASGRLRFAPNIAWRDVDLPAALVTLGVPVVADNDCTAATFGEHRAGAARGLDDVVYVGVGTGIGGGIVSAGRILRGANGFAGEIGHIVVEPGGIVCGCGNRGCWETVASGSAVTRLGRERLDPSIDGYGVAAAAHDGDQVARKILAEVGHRLGQGIAGLVNVLDPTIVVLGGGAVAGAGDFLLQPARAALDGAVEGGEFRPAVPLVPAALGRDGAAIGAALWALEESA
jgi:glucokinase